MTDEHDTNGDGWFRRSRRTVLATTFGLPVIGGVGVSAADAVNRLTAPDLATEQSLDGSQSAASVTVDFPTDRHPLSREQFTALTADPQLLGALDVSPGDQLRLRRGDEHALFTVVGALTESDPATVRTSRLARTRLDVEGTTWSDVGDFGRGCPTLVGGSDLADQRFDVVADPAVVADRSVSEARAEGDLVEQRDGTGTELAILAPHGGDVEPHTAEQAERMALGSAADFTFWRALGFDSEAGSAFLRWHVPSTEISGDSFPALAGVLEEDYRYAISVHGICAGRIRVGGGAPESIKTLLRDSINSELPADAPEAVVATGRFAATSDDVLVNRVSDNGIWLGQPAEARRDYGEAIVDAVLKIYDDLLVDAA